MTVKASSTSILVPSAIVGLGNPEPKYDRTRHNIGFAVVDALARSWQIPLTPQRKFKGEYGEGMAIAGQKIRLLKPSTYMNRSGEAVQAVASWYKLDPASVLVIYDDMDLPVGRIRLRLAGSAGGHNGMKSIIAHLGTQAFPRLRVGIGKPQPGENPSISHVLGKFSPQENQVMTEVMTLVRDAIELSLKEGVEKSMSLYNSRNLAKPPSSKASS
ncbi:aminoacyl-tRNA hydrolase [Geitlerinema sp. P-1104]|uniref:aminoacyl-tRNA hydrolase n=1 Tax=Geitlerinema sp. P-1104 TaxID=2546230 RepID=UPI0014776158|nr:aminoacyl-tRNA hydrolase [Geitlerinema sp. P-1104]NMG57091.1 aminoacyl-tRNA hydrolase [Geitlerinema sp. P-1104]